MEPIITGPPLPTPAEDISLISPQLYLGNFGAAVSEPILRRYAIRHVFSVISNREAIPFNRRVAGITYKHMHKNDMPGEDMMLSFEEAVEYISKAVAANEPVLVHCQMGVSRSATIVIVYLMRANGWPFDTAMHYLKSRRPAANPNWGFRYQLKLYERMSLRLDANCKEFRLYLLNAMVFRNYSDEFHGNLRQYLDKLQEIERATKLTVSAAYKCIKCTRSVFFDLNVLKANDHSNTTIREACKYFLIEPIVWMLHMSTGQYLFADFPNKSTGLIPCPHCNQPIGKFAFFPFQCQLCSCQEHRSIKSFLSLEIHRDAVFKRSTKPPSFIDKLLGNLK